jgi:hypothetical protein
MTHTLNTDSTRNVIPNPHKSFVMGKFWTRRQMANKCKYIELQVRIYTGRNKQRKHGNWRKRQANYIERNNGAPSCNHCCSRKAKIITYSECVFVALGIQHEMCMRHFVICGLYGSKYFSTLSHKRQEFRKKKKVIEHSICVLIFYAAFVWNISHSRIIEKLL